MFPHHENPSSSRPKDRRSLSYDQNIVFGETLERRLAQETEVVALLRDTRNERLLIKIALQLAINPFFNKIIIKGTPGSGKTTLRKQLRRAMSYLEPNIEFVDLHNFDVVCAGLLKEKGQPNTKLWLRRDWEQLMWCMHSNIEEELQKPSLKRKIAFIEIPAIGFPATTFPDRAALLAEYYALQERDVEKDKFATLFLTNIAHPALQERTIRLRDAVSEAQKPNELAWILEQYGIDIGAPMTQEVFIHLKYLFSIMADGEYIEIIRREQQRMTAKNELISSPLQQHMYFPDELRTFPDEVARHLRAQASSAEFQYRERGIGPDRYSIVFNLSYHPYVHYLLME